MKRRLRRLTVFAGVLGLVMAVNVGVASADHGLNPNSPFGTTPGEAVSPSPVGSHLIGPGPDGPGAPGAINGFNFEFGGGVDPTNPAVIALANNPNCPFHYA